MNLSSVFTQYPRPVRVDGTLLPDGAILVGRYKAILVVTNDGFFAGSFGKTGGFGTTNFVDVPNGVTVFGDFRTITIGEDTVLIAYPF